MSDAVIASIGLRCIDQGEGRIDGDGFFVTVDQSALGAGIAGVGAACLAPGLVDQKPAGKHSADHGLVAQAARSRTASAVLMSADWAAAVHAVFRDKAIRQIGTVPDAGLTRLLDLCTADNAMRVMTLTREDEGVGLLTGAWLGGERAALLMQSSGVGNVVNALSLPSVMKAPCLMLVTMRGQWGEANGWQVPMGSATPGVLEAMGVTCYPVDRAEDVAETVSAAADMAFNACEAAAVLVGQRVIGIKAFEAGVKKTPASGGDVS